MSMFSNENSCVLLNIASLRFLAKPQDAREQCTPASAPNIRERPAKQTTGGMGKRSCVSTYRKTNRGARGVVNVRLRENETVLGVVQVTDEDELMMTTERGQLVRIPVHEIRRVGRAAKGVIIMRLNDGDRITGISKVAASEKTESAATTEQPENANTVQEPVPPRETPVAEEQTPEQE